MDISVATMRIARDVSRAEIALNEALIAQSDLYGQLLRARKETESDPFLGHVELLRLMKAQQSLLASSGDLARVHGGLLDVQQVVAGIRECPESGALAETAEQAVA